MLRHIPSAHSSLFGTRAWVCSCGSPARDVRWSNSAAANPPVRTCSTPSVPRRDNAAWLSRYARAARTAARCACATWVCAVAPPNAHSTLTLFGAENVRSNPVTPPPPPRPTECLSGDGVQAAGEHRFQLLLTDLAIRLEAEFREPAAHPHAGLLAGTEVVLARADRDRGLVIPPGGAADLRRRQHRCFPPHRYRDPTPSPYIRRMHMSAD